MSPVPQPPFPAELLADLHAGNIDPELGARLWPVVRHDPEARRYLDSLDEVSRSLAGLAGSGDIVRPMPRDIAARLDNLAESLGRESSEQVRQASESTEVAPAADPSAAESSGTGAAPRPPGNPGAANAPGPEPVVATPIRLDSRRRRRQVAATLAAAALVAIAASAALIGLRSGEGGTPPTAAPAPGENLGPGGELDTAVALRALGRNDVSGRLSDPAALTACVRAAGIDRPVLGSTGMRFDTRDDAVLILVGGRGGAQITALVVGSGCGPGNPEVLATTDIG
ncbi:hypothetical protein [Nocardia sp. NPDC024068]|uniref:hypothetical protein n=1 Tax=Nocardia sp. NPDC024068 TaxID=3157197 RepID=UPI0033FCD138